MTTPNATPSFVRCLDDGGFPVSLEVRGVYRCKEDAKAAEKGLLRVVDETGEDYLYPRGLFEAVADSEGSRLARRRR